MRDRDRRLGVAVLAAAAVAGVAALLLMAWWGTVPDPLPGAPVHPTPGSLREGLARAIGYLRLSGLLLLPVVLACGPVATARRAWAAGRATTLVLTGIVATGLGFSTLPPGVKAGLVDASAALAEADRAAAATFVTAEQRRYFACAPGSVRSAIDDFVFLDAGVVELKGKGAVASHYLLSRKEETRSVIKFGAR